MGLGSSLQGRNILREITAQNPEAAARLNELRKRATEEVVEDYGLPELTRASYPHLPASIDDITFSAHGTRRALVGVVALTGGLICLLILFGAPLYQLLVQHWKSSLLGLGCILLGAGLIVVVRTIEASPLRDVQVPSKFTGEPLEELEQLARRSVSRLRTAYRVQCWIVIGVAIVFVSVVSWSIYMVTQRRLEYGAAFGSGSVGMLILSKWKWQPFDRIANARKLADDADILATGLRLRIGSINEIPDPERRATAQWEAVREYLAVS